MDALIDEWKSKEKIRKSNTVLYFILIDNQKKCKPFFNLVE